VHIGARAEAPLDSFARSAKIHHLLEWNGPRHAGEGHPFQVFGSRKEALRAADVIILLGAEFDFRLGFGQPGTIHKDAVIVQVDIDASRIGRNRGTVGVVCDIAQFLKSLLSHEGLFGPPSYAEMDY